MQGHKSLQVLFPTDQSHVCYLSLQGACRIFLFWAALQDVIRSVPLRCSNEWSEPFGPFYDREINSLSLGSRLSFCSVVFSKCTQIALDPLNKRKAVIYKVSGYAHLTWGHDCLPRKLLLKLGYHFIEASLRFFWLLWYFKSFKGAAHIFQSPRIKELWFTEDGSVLVFQHRISLATGLEANVEILRNCHVSIC